MAWLLWRHPERFASAAARVGATIDLTLIGYFAVPTAPPWWASEREGRLGHDVRRVVDEVRKDLRGEPRPGSDHNSGVNPWAAMPSDHFASALAVAAVLAEADPRAGIAGGAYAGLLGLSLVYAGEHYVADLLAGAALAAVGAGGGKQIERCLGTAAGRTRNQTAAARRRRKAAWRSFAVSSAARSNCARASASRPSRSSISPRAAGRSE